MEYEEKGEGDLRSLCGDRGLESTGTKEELIERLMDDDEEEAMEYAKEAKRYLLDQEETDEIVRRNFYAQLQGICPGPTVCNPLSASLLGFYDFLRSQLSNS